jgi:hypothetical protein
LETPQATRLGGLVCVPVAERDEQSTDRNALGLSPLDEGVGIAGHEGEHQLRAAVEASAWRIVVMLVSQT